MYVTSIKRLQQCIINTAKANNGNQYCQLFVYCSLALIMVKWMYGEHVKNMVGLFKACKIKTYQNNQR